MFSEALLLGGLLTATGVTIYLANLVVVGQNEHAAHWVRLLQLGFVILIFILGLTLLQAAFLTNMANEYGLEETLYPPIDRASALVTFLVALLATVIGYRAISRPATQQRIADFLKRWGGTYNPQSPIHTTALLLMLAIMVYALATFVLQGGITGMADSMEANSPSIDDALFQMVLEIVVSLLGVGLAIRRGVPQTLQRLGLRKPTQQDIIAGVGLGLTLWVALLLISMVWTVIVTPEVLEEQTSATQKMTLAFSTLPLAFMLSLVAAIGEEIWLRGALQPVFGIVATSLFFTSLHIQVAFTPGMLIIFGLSLVLGWLRQRYSTTATIIAHFVYNFIQLGLAALLIEAV